MKIDVDQLSIPGSARALDQNPQGRVNNIHIKRLKCNNEIKPKLQFNFLCSIARRDDKSSKLYNGNTFTFLKEIEHLIVRWSRRKLSQKRVRR